jgi:phage terminase large subunit-like protein
VVLTDSEFSLLSKDKKSAYIKSLKQIRCKTDLVYLLKEVLGYGEVDRGVHGKIVEFLEGGSKKKLLLMPRGAFKTTVVSIGGIIQQILRNPNIRILIDSEVMALSEKILAQIKRDMQKPEFVGLFGNMISSEHRETAGEFTVSARTNMSLKEPTVTVGGIGTVKVGNHYDLIIADDLHSEQNVSTKDQIEKVISHYRLLLSLLEPDGKMVVVGCLVKGTNVLMSTGEWKSIECIVPGEFVVSWDKGKKVIKPVEAVIPQGVDDVYELKTGNHTVRATGNHPFLLPDGTFKRLDALAVGDQIMSMYGARGCRRSFGSMTKDEAWLLGFMFGDGWVTESPNSKGSMRYVVCFAKCIYLEINNRAIKIFQDKFNCKVTETKFGYYRIDSNPTGKWLRSLGFKGKAKTKRIPADIFKKEIEVRRSFIEGFVAADGHIDKHNRANVEISNKPFTEDLRRLCITSGFKPSNIYERTRMIQAPHSKSPVESKTCHISFNTVPGNYGFKKTRIRAIEKIGQKEVWDLTVADTHNFIAEGLVTHNTRWHFMDLYSYIIEEESIRPGSDWAVLVEKAIRDDGSLFFPNRLTQEFLDEQQRSQGSYLFSVLYQNDPVSREDAIFKKEDFRYWEGIDFPLANGKRIFLNIYILIDRAFSTKDNADFTGCAVIGVSTTGNVYVLEAQRHKFGLQELFTLITSWIKKFGADRVRKIGIETINMEEVEAFFKEQMRKRNNYFILEQLSPDRGLSKERRISAALEARVRMHTLYLKKGLIELEDEMMRFPKCTHDDIIDAVAYIVQFMTIPGGSDFETEDVSYEPSGWFGKTGY